MISDVISHIKSFAVSGAKKIAKASVFAFRKCKEYAFVCKNVGVKLIGIAKELYNKFLCCPKCVKVSILSAVSVFVLFIGLSCAGVRFGFKVNYEGNMIATVKNKAQFGRAVAMVEDKVNGEDVKGAVSTPDYSLIITHTSKVSKDEDIANQIIEKSKGIVSATAVMVEDEHIATVHTDKINAYLEELYNKSKPEGVECQVGFEGNVKFQEGYFVLSDVKEVSDVSDKLSALTVKAVATVTSEVSVNYNTITNTTDKKSVGYKQVQVKGQKGVNKVTEEIVYINGVESSRKTLSTMVVTKPVDEVVLVGNAKATASKSEITMAKNSGFMFPLPKGTWQVSAWWGDCRIHQALDIRAPKGTSIFAVADGTVIDTGYTNSYGYYVKVRHNNGIVTMYAHASQVCVKRGETVKQGDVIALVGRTGNATGNHLHFEVIVNGVIKNPAPYLGLY